MTKTDNYILSGVVNVSSKLKKKFFLFQYCFRMVFPSQDLMANCCNGIVILLVTYFNSNETNF